MKKRLIHWLGGYTEQELNEECELWCSAGQEIAYDELIRYAKTINGCSAEEWCNQMWQVLIGKRNKNK